jgi:lysophospholipase L1-like esterase
VSTEKLDAPKTYFSWPILKGIDIKGSAESAAIVTFGDSITDGALSTRNANARWPDVLAKRLQADKKTANLGIINEGIGGNRVLHDVAGPSALARFDRDVLAQAGVKYLIIMESINDIGHAADPVKPYDVVSAEDIIFGLGQLAERARTHGIKVYGATLTPYGGAKYASPAGETMRTAVNNWIRTTKQLDGFIDFDKATQDPANPTVYLPANDSGDHLHPKDAGYKVMGEYIDLKLFESK